MKQVLPIAAACIALSALSGSALSNPPPEYGFVDVNVSCHVQDGKVLRAKLVSPVFAFCWTPSIGDTILSDAASIVSQTAKNTCGGAFEITNQFVSHTSSRSAAEQRMNAEYANQAYQLRASVGFYPAYYSSQCK